MKNEKRYGVVETAVGSFFLLTTLAILIDPFVNQSNAMTHYTVHIMLAMLLASLLMMFFKMRRLLFLGLSCTFLIAIFLKTASNTELKFPDKNDEPKIKVAHFNLSNFEADIDVLMDFLPYDSIDVLSFQELTPFWEEKITSRLAEQYPYHKSVVRIDPYGLALFSKAPFSAVDTFMVENIPNMVMTVDKGPKSFKIISSYITPALDRISKEQAAQQLGAIASKIQGSQEPVISIGDFNMVYWANEIRDYISEAQLINSRRDILGSNLRVPFDHIFFSSQLECVQFTEIQDTSSKHIGIVGTYQPALSFRPGISGEGLEG